MQPVACSPQSHSQLKKLMRRRRIDAGLRPEVLPIPRKTVTRYDEFGEPRVKHYILHPTKGWRLA